MTKLHIETVGHGEPLILLHGWGLHGGLFTPLYAPLMHRFRLHNIDLPGHGHSAPVHPFSLENLVRTLHEATAQIETPLTILGWSFGGMLAQAWALREPTRIKRLVLSCTKPKFVRAEDWPHGTAPEVLQSFVDDFSAKPQETMQRFLALNVIGAESARETLAQMKAIAHARGAVHHVALAEGLRVLSEFDAREHAAKITQPTLIITGGLDRLTHPSVGEWYAARIAKSQHVHFERAAHAPHLSHTRAYAQAVLDFAEANP